MKVAMVWLALWCGIGCRQILGLHDLPQDASSDEPSTDADAEAVDAFAPSDVPGVAVDAFVPAFVARYNIGGSADPAYTGIDFPGNWAADPGDICTGTGASTLSGSAPISGTVDDALFQRQIYGLPTVTCRVPVANGKYAVTLLFGPLYYGGGATPACQFPKDQIFDIAIEGVTVLPAWNLTAASGGCVENGSTAHPVAQAFTATVTDGAVDIVLTAPTGEGSMISALQIVSAP